MNFMECWVPSETPAGQIEDSSSPEAFSGSATANSVRLTIYSGKATTNSGEPTKDSGRLTSYSGRPTKDSGQPINNSGRDFRLSKLIFEVSGWNCDVLAGGV